LSGFGLDNPTLYNRISGLATGLGRAYNPEIEDNKEEKLGF